MNLASILIRKRCQESRNISCASAVTFTTSVNYFCTIFFINSGALLTIHKGAPFPAQAEYLSDMLRKSAGSLVLIRPPARYDFCFRIEIHAIFTQRVQVAEE